MRRKAKTLTAGLAVLAIGLTGVAVWAAQPENPSTPPGQNPSAGSDQVIFPADTMNRVPTPPPPTDPNPVANPSLEDAGGSPPLPEHWLNNSWGDNTATFDYVTDDGHEGTRSVKVTVTDYVDGDAKWLPEPLELEPGKQYRYTAWYKTDGRAQVVAMVVNADGSESFYGMPQPLPPENAATEWQPYTESFTVPSDAVSVAPFMFLASDGFLQVDDVDIQPYTPSGFDRPIVTLTFDDGHEDNATTARPAMDARGLTSTQCFATQYITDSAVAKQAVLDFRDSGHEICSHSVTHPFMTQLAPEQLAEEAESSRDYLRELTGEPVGNFATPYGDYNASVVTELQEYYQSHRTVDEGFNSKDNFDRFRIRVQNMTPTTSLEQFQGWLDHAEATSTWLVLVYHRITENPDDAGPFDTPLANFEPQLDALVESGITVLTWQAALEELVPQVQ
jgi:peptidoglycan/xylan/chitin deacetylase (PgdA/CDA1 family)